MVKRNQVDENYKWDLSSLYINNTEWEKDIDKLREGLDELGTYRGRILEHDNLKKVLYLNRRLSIICDNIHTYAELKNSQDTTDSTNQCLLALANAEWFRKSTALSYFTPEILGYSENEVLEKTKELKIEEFNGVLKAIFRGKNHILSEIEEELISKIIESYTAPATIYSALEDGDILFEDIILKNGETIVVNEANYLNLSRSSNSEIRKKAFRILFGKYKELKNTFGATLISDMKNMLNISKIRKYNSSLEKALFFDDIPYSVYTNLIKGLRTNISSLHMYMDIKKNTLRLNTLHIYDVHASLSNEVNVTYSIEEARKIVTQALTVLGEDYIMNIDRAFDEKWIDFLPNNGKRGGAYSSGTYTSKPYILMNYIGEISDVSTLAHELGHSIHTHYSNTSQPYEYSGYSMFSAEVASAVNEIILINYLINNATDEKMKKFFVCYELEQIKNTVFRQGMFAEFEFETHTQLQKNGAITADNLCDIWYELNCFYFGDGVKCDELIRYEWERIPHFFNSFYVYQYATGYCAARCFANGILSGDKNIIDNYKEFLKSGGVKYPIDILELHGIDMLSDNPINKVIDRFNELLAMLK